MKDLSCHARIVRKMIVSQAGFRFAFTVFILFLCEVASSDSVIKTNNGPVRGVPSLEKDVEAFLGIPFAEPPVGELRFAKPIPKKEWQDVYNAEKLPPACAQSSLKHSYYFMPHFSNMSEDCLYLNIWVPKSQPTSGLRPVLVFFHHGGFVMGSSGTSIHDGSRLASRGDVIVCTVNYRLGTLGFLMTDTEEAAGSMGMYDQVMGIKWIKQNAKLFGGDPENIVLMGVSAGGCSVSAHLASPLSKNLFKKAIVQSGSYMSPLFEDNVRLREASQSVASIVGCTNGTASLKGDLRSVVKCLKSKPIEAFANAEEILLKSNPLIFYPRINDPFLPKSLATLLREGSFRKDINLLVGMNDREGALFLISGLPEYFGYYGENDVRMSKHRAAVLGRSLVFLARESNASEISAFYLNLVKNRTSEGYSIALSNMMGDFVISCNTVFFADILSVKGNAVYFYKFQFRSPSTPLAEWIGVTHLDEVQYVFGNPYHQNFTSQEIELSHRLMDRWSAFAKTGNPNIPGRVPWLQYSYQDPLYMNFGQEEESIRLKPNDRCEFWRKRFRCDFDPELIQFLRNSEKVA